MIALGSAVTYREQPLDRRHIRRIVTAAAFVAAETQDHKRAYESLMVDISPIARTLLGHVAGDVVTVETGFGRKVITIEGVR